ncbi:MAG: restriction endonuclease subunit S [Christensenellales bacterium]|jgi:type I restriction enzyme S subunit
MTPEQLKASILQYAIQGKLVEQRPEEGTGEELYQQIQAEKQRLIKEKKIKKEKTLAEITEGEIPFDIPDSWKWVKLGDCTGYAQTKEKVSPKDITGDMWSLDLEDVQKDTGAILVKTKASERKISGDKVKFHKGQVLYSKLRPYLKKILVAPDGGICTPELVPFDTYLIDENYIAYVLRSPHIDYVINSVTYGVKMPRVGTDTMTNLLIPLPPLAEQKRIVAKIEELLPYVDRYATAYEKLDQFNAKFPNDMKKSILEYAIQGKLVEQRAEEGTGEELYRQIQAEKQQLIKEGKIKKEKPLPEIVEDEIPFDIPESWKWVRLSEIISVLGDGIHGTPVFDEMGDYYFVNGNNLAKGHIVFKADTKKVSFDEYEKHKKPLDENTILISINGTIGNYAFYAGEPIILGKSACYFSVLTGVDKEYVRHLINTKFFMDYAVKEATQTTIKNVSLKAMRMLPVPLPPLAEQKRIVAKLEEILPLCERLK